MLRRFTTDESGAILPALVLALVPLLWLMLYLIDFGRASQARTAAQSGADAGALAALRVSPGRQAAHAAHATAERIRGAGAEPVEVRATRHRDGRLEVEAKGRLSKVANPLPERLQPEFATRTVIHPATVACSRPVPLPTNLNLRALSRPELELMRGTIRLRDGTFCRREDIVWLAPRVGR